MKKTILVAVLVLLAGFSVSAAPDRPKITLQNSTGYEVEGIYVSPSDSEHWGDDYLVNMTLDDGDSFTLTLPEPLSETNLYDIMFEDIEASRYCLFDIPVTNGETIEITLDDLYEDYSGDEETE